MKVTTEKSDWRGDSETCGRSRIINTNTYI